jgi:hypothetical protein
MNRRKIMTRKKYWLGHPPGVDSFGKTIYDVFIDGKTTEGPWAFMTPLSFELYGMGLGTGLGQKYKKQDDGKWLKIGG